MLKQNPNGRPYLLRMDRVVNCIIEGVTWLNSPMYHLFLNDISNFVIQDFEIYVDVFEQKQISKLFGLFDDIKGMPTYPTNTDGVDPSGTNILIKNLKITNFDDAIAVKPADGNNKIATCA